MNSMQIKKLCMPIYRKYIFSLGICLKRQKNLPYNILEKPKLLNIYISLMNEKYTYFEYCPLTSSNFSSMSELYDKNHLKKELMLLEIKKIKREN